jgi:hypothetical protein
MQVDDPNRLPSLRLLYNPRPVAKVHLATLMRDRQGCDASGPPRARLRHQFTLSAVTQPCYQSTILRHIAGNRVLWCAS